MRGRPEMARLSRPPVSVSSVGQGVGRSRGIWYRSIEAGPSRRARPAGAEARMIVEVRCVVLVLTTEHAVAADLANGVTIGELGMGDVARRRVGPLAAGTAVATPVSGALAGLGSGLQYGDHVLMPSPGGWFASAGCRHAVTLAKPPRRAQRRNPGTGEVAPRATRSPRRCAPGDDRQGGLEPEP